MKEKSSLSEKEKIQIRSLLEEGRDVTQITHELGLGDSDLIYDVTYATPIKTRVSIATRKYNISISRREIDNSYQRVIETIRRVQQQKGPLKVLEQGCGNGTFARKVATEFPECQIDGIDLSEAGVEHARNTHPLPNTNFWRADGYRVDRDESYDVVYHVNVLEHIQDKERYLEESMRLLKKDGVLIVAFPSEDYWRFWGFPKYLACLLLRRPFQTHACSVGRVSKFLGRTNRQVSTFRWGFFIPRRLYYYVPLKILKRFGESLEGIERDFQALNLSAPMMFACYIVAPEDSPAIILDIRGKVGSLVLLRLPWTLTKAGVLWLAASFLMVLEVASGKKTFFLQN